MKQFKTLLLLITFAGGVIAQSDVPQNVHFKEMKRKNVRRTITIPDILGYQTLKCDFHNHTAYSDGAVWPDFRVQEGWMEGLDVLAFTDHLRSKPSNPNAIGDDNKPYEIGKPWADEYGMILIKGAEISKGKDEGGHINALFITDVAKVNKPNLQDAVEEAVRQGGFLTWNHPGNKMFEANEKLIKEGKIQGIELFNTSLYSPQVHKWANEYNLAPLAVTDSHFPIRTAYYDSYLRPMTLVLAKERTEVGVKEALIARRTIAFFNGHLAGKEEYLKALFEASISIKKMGYIERWKENGYEISNNSDLTFILSTGENALYIEPRSVARLEVKVEVKKIEVAVINCHTTYNETLKHTIILPE